MGKRESKESTNIQDLLKTVKDSYKDLIFIGNDESLVLKTIPSGIGVLDNLLAGGFRRGSLNEISGAFTTGKTFIVYNTIKSVQSQNGKCVLIDSERRYEPKWAKIIGIDVDNLIVVRPNTGEQAFEILYSYLNEVDLIAIDSFAALLPTALAEQEEMTPTMGVMARMMSQGLAKATVNNKNTVILATNQLRADIGTRYHPGILEKMTGGSAQYYYAASIIQTRRKGFLLERKAGDIIEEDNESRGKDYKRVGFIMECLVTKCNYAPSFGQKCQVNINFVTGQVDNFTSLIDLAVDLEIIEHGGGPWYQYNGEKIQGRQGLYDWFNSHREEFEGLKNKVLNK